MEMRAKGKNPAPGFINHPVHRIDLFPLQKRMVAKFNGETIIDSSLGWVMEETGYPVRYYLPAQEVNQHLLVPTGHSTYCPFKGRASYWDLNIRGESLQYALWSYKMPFDEMEKIAGWFSFYQERLDEFFILSVEQ